MRKKIVITDITRMSGDKVCIAGYDKYPSPVRCVRPTFPSGSSREDWLYVYGVPVIRPFAEVELEFTRKPSVIPPHTEDYIIDSAVPPSRTRVFSNRQKLAWLKALDDRFVENIFGTPIRRGPGYYVTSGEGYRSLGTVKPSWVHEVSCEESNGNRIKFSDGRSVYKLKVTDLTFLYYINWRKETKTSEQVSREVLRHLRDAEHVFLRIGLARHWRKYPDRCYLQITGMYTFPDYLNGKCFCDFV